MPQEHTDGFQLVPHHWYAWQMLPGYLNDSQPFYSPVYVTNVAPRSNGRDVWQVDFFNVLYLDGAQDFHLHLQVIHQHPAFLVTELLYADESLQRVAIISRIGFGWLTQHCQHVIDQYPPALFGRAAEKDIFTYLNRAFPYVRRKLAHFR